jgi:hypothetical protein
MRAYRGALVSWDWRASALFLGIVGGGYLVGFLASLAPVSTPVQGLIWSGCACAGLVVYDLTVAGFLRRWLHRCRRR